jgi:hypothetical protein
MQSGGGGFSWGKGVHGVTIKPEPKDVAYLTYLIFFLKGSVFGIFAHEP